MPRTSDNQNRTSQQSGRPETTCYIRPRTKGNSFKAATAPKVRASRLGRTNLGSVRGHSHHQSRAGKAALLIRSLPSSTRATRTARVKLFPPMPRMKTERFEDFHSRPPSSVLRASYSTAKIAPVQEIGSWSSSPAGMKQQRRQGCPLERLTSHFHLVLANLGDTTIMASS